MTLIGGGEVTCKYGTVCLISCVCLTKARESRGGGSHIRKFLHISEGLVALFLKGTAERSPTEAVALESKDSGYSPGVPWILICVGRGRGSRAVYVHLLCHVLSVPSLHRALNLLRAHARPCPLVIQASSDTSF